MTTQVSPGIWYLCLVLIAAFLVMEGRRFWKTRQIDARIVLVVLVGCSQFLAFIASDLIYPFYQARYLPYSCILTFVMMAMVLARTGRARYVLAAGIVVLFVSQSALAGRPFRPEWSRLAETVDDGRPVLIYPKYELRTAAVLKNDIVKSLRTEQELKQQLRYYFRRKGGWLIFIPVPGSLDAPAIVSILNQFRFEWSVEDVETGWRTIQVYKIEPVSHSHKITPIPESKG